MIAYMITIYAIVLFVDIIITYFRSRKDKFVSDFFIAPIIGFAMIQGVVNNQDVTQRECSVTIGVCAILYGIYWFVCTIISRKVNNRQ